MAKGDFVPSTMASKEPWNINTFNKPIILPAFVVALEGIAVLANRKVMGIRRKGGKSNKNINHKRKEIHLVFGSRDTVQLIHAECNPILFSIIL